jgi:hypothetical protein
MVTKANMARIMEYPPVSSSRIELKAGFFVFMPISILTFYNRFYIFILHMIRLKGIVTEIQLNETEETDISETITIGEKGYLYLKNTIDQLNEKAAKYHVPPMELKVLKEEIVTKNITVNAFTGQRTTGDDLNSELREVKLKEYQVKIEGKPPRVEGYEFIAKIEHTSEGNLLNFSPNSSVKNLPSEYVTASQKCDVCHTQRDRNNTYVLRMEKDEPSRFPDKKAGDLLMVGSSCLKRFLPGITIAALTSYAALIEQIREAIKSAGGDNDDVSFGGGGGSHNYFEKKQLVFFLAAAYLQLGKYVSSKKAEEFRTESTLGAALSAMHPTRDSRRTDKVLEKLNNDPSFKPKAEAMVEEFSQWESTKDFDALAAEKPDYASFYSNCKVLAKLTDIKASNSAKVAGMFGLFLYDKGQIEKKAAQAKAGEGFAYFGTPGEKVKLKVKVKKIHEYENKFSGGTAFIVSLYGEMTEPDGTVKKGNLTNFTTTPELDVDEEAEVEATVKEHQISKYTNLPDTIITRIKVLNFITHPEKNAGKEKIKEWTGIAKVIAANTQRDWHAQPPVDKYFVTFGIDTEAHPDMRDAGSNWGARLTYQAPSLEEFERLKAFTDKKVKIKAVLSKAMKRESILRGGAMLKAVEIEQVLS